MAIATNQRNMSEPIVLFGVGELARRAGVCSETLRRKLLAASANELLRPDAVVLTGKRRMAVYHPGRAAAILTLLNSTPDPIV